LEAPVVGFDEDGARELGSVYWVAVERSLLGSVRGDRRSRLVELRLFGVGPALLRFGEPEVDVAQSSVVCRYPITGGVLARRARGEISFTQVEDDGYVLCSAIRDFFPTLAARAWEAHWTGALYNHVQSRIHTAISRRYFARLVAAPGR
jgi:hypothetical protein